jgi:D-alanyl-D-alanine carboxypeptidase
MDTQTPYRNFPAIAHKCFPRHLAWMVFVCFLTAIASAPAMANYASLIMDSSNGRILHEVNADAPRYPASLTKMMTLYLAFEALDDGRLGPDQRLWVSAHAASQPPTKLGLRPGQTITVENAILALVTKSANDMAAAVAEGVAGSEPVFAGRMTARARQLGMERTWFANASGLPDPDQVTTARDMSILALALVHDFPHYYHYFSTEHFVYGGAVHPNHNRLLGAYGGLDGIKTGYTYASGFNLVASARRDGQRLIGVVLGARSPTSRSVIMTSLLDQAFAGREVIDPYAEPDLGLPMVSRSRRQNIETAARGRQTVRVSRSRSTNRAVASARSRTVASARSRTVASARSRAVASATSNRASSAASRKAVSASSRQAVVASPSRGKVVAAKGAPVRTVAAKSTRKSQSAAIRATSRADKQMQISGSPARKPKSVVAVASSKSKARS